MSHESSASPPIRFSILTATYNRERLLPRCIDSVLAQTFSNFEMLVVDDGSQDGTWDLLQEYAARDSRIRPLRQVNAGANAARNYGAREARGEFVFVLDSDDDVVPHWLEVMDQLIQTRSADVACCGLERVREDGSRINVAVPANSGGRSARGGVFLSGTYAIRRELFLRVGGFNEQLKAHQSTDLQMRLEHHAKESECLFAFTDELLSRGHPNAATNRIRHNPTAKLEATKYILEHHRQRLQHRSTIASWEASAGGCAAELGDYAQARRFFARAIRTQPTGWKNYARWVATFIPWAQRRFWRPHFTVTLGQTHEPS